MNYQKENLIKNNMNKNKVKNIYYYDDIKDSCDTGLFIEMEDGRIYRHQTTSLIIPFKRVKELPNNQNK